MHIQCYSSHDSQKLETDEMYIIFMINLYTSSNMATDPSSVFKCPSTVIYVIQPFLNKLSLTGPVLFFFLLWTYIFPLKCLIPALYKASFPHSSIQILATNCYPFKSILIPTELEFWCLLF